MAKYTKEDELAVTRYNKALREGNEALLESLELTETQRELREEMMRMASDMAAKSVEDLKNTMNKKILLAEELKIQREVLETIEAATDEKDNDLKIRRKIFDMEMEHRIATEVAQEAALAHRLAAIEEDHKILEAKRLIADQILGHVAASEEELKLAEEKLGWGDLSEEQKETAKIHLHDEMVLSEKNLITRRRGHELEEQNLKAQRRGTEALTQMKDHLEDSLSAATGINSEWEKTGWGMMAKAMGSTAGGAAGMEMFKNALADTVEPSKVFGSTILKVQEKTLALATAQDESIAGFRKATGAGKEFSDSMIDAEIENRHLGVTTEMVGESIGALHSQMADFTKLTEEMQSKLVQASAQMQQLGIDANTSAELFENVQNSLGLTGEEAIATGFELAGLAKGIGVAPAEMAKGFSAAQGQLAAWGKDSIKIFKGVAAAAKATGIESQRLLAIVGQFDTFTGAAEAAGKLNAILGGNLLNSVDMLTASEDERIRMMIQSIEVSGRSWESMNKFERMAVANAAGISDMAEANKLFGQSLSAYDEMQQKAKESVFTQAELEDQMQGGMTVGEKWNQVLQGLSLSMRPLVNALHGLIEFILWLQSVTHGAFGYIALFATGMYALAAAVNASTWATFVNNAETMRSITLGTIHNLMEGKRLKRLWDWIKAKGVAFWAWVTGSGATVEDTAVTGVNTGVQAVNTAGTVTDSAMTKINTEVKKKQTKAKKEGTKATKSAGKAAGSAALSMLAFGAAVMMVGAGIYLAATGLAQFVAAFNQMTEGQILAVSVAIGVFALAMIGLALVMLKAAAIGAPLVLLAFGAAFLLIGAGVALAAVGMAGFVSSIQNLFVSGGLTLENIALLPLFALGIYALIVAMTSLGAFLVTPIGWVAIEGLAIVLVMLAATIWAITPALMMLSTLFSELSGATATAKIDVEAGEGSALMQTLKLVKEVEELGTLENTKAVTEYAMKLQAAAGAAGAGSGAAAGGGFKKKSEKAQQTIVLKLDNRELGRAVVEVLNKSANLKIAT